MPCVFIRLPCVFMWMLDFVHDCGFIHAVSLCIHMDAGLCIIAGYIRAVALFIHVKFVNALFSA